LAVLYRWEARRGGGWVSRNPTNPLPGSATVWSVYNRAESGWASSRAAACFKSATASDSRGPGGPDWVPWYPFFRRPFVKRFELCYGTIVCLSVCAVLSVLSVCDVGVLWPNCWMNQDETWHAGRSRTWPHCVRWGPSSPPLKGHCSPFFGPYQLWPNGWMD